MPESSDPKLAETLDAPVYQPPKPGRSLAGFYIGLGIVAALVGLGVVLYPHLRLQYAIHQVRSSTREDDRGTGERIQLVSEAAQHGNGNAIAALILYQKQTLGSPLYLWMVGTGPTEVRTAFYRQLDRWPDDDAIRVLLEVADFVGQDVSRQLEDYRYDRETGEIREVVIELKPLLVQASATLEPLSLTTSDPNVQGVVRDLLAYIRLRFAGKFVEENALQDLSSGDASCRQGALRWLCHLPASDAVLATVLVKALSDPSWPIRRDAAMALCHQKWKDTPEVVPALIKALSIPETEAQSPPFPPFARDAACKALGVLGDPRAIGPLEALAKADNWWLARGASDALEKIRGRETAK